MRLKFKLIRITMLLAICTLLAQTALAAPGIGSSTDRLAPTVPRSTPSDAPTVTATFTLIPSNDTATPAANINDTATPISSPTATLTDAPSATATATTLPSATASATIRPTATLTDTPTTTATTSAPLTPSTTPTLQATLTPATASPTPSSGGSYDVVVVGGTSAGVGAAIAAARQGARTALIADGTWLGGMISAGGLGATDGDAVASSGLFEEFRLRVREYYKQQRDNGQLFCNNPAPVVVDDNYANPTNPSALIAKLMGGTYNVGYATYTWNMSDGKAYLQMKNLICNLAWQYPTNGYNYEPGVANAMLQQMVQAEPNLTLLPNSPYTGAITEGNRILGVNVLTTTGGFTHTASVLGRVTIDATYTGDVLADAGTRWQDYVFGREPRTTANAAPPPLRSRAYNEPDAGKTYAIPFETELGDGDYGLMAYSYLLTLEYAPSRPLIPNPFANIPDRNGRTGDQNETYQSYVRGFESQTIYWWNDIWYQWRRFIPGNKLELNMADIPGANYVALDSETNYLTDRASRAQIDQQHRLYALSLLYWAQSRVPAAQGWRPTYEYNTADGAPLEMYIREGYRMVGLKTMQEQDFGCTASGCDPQGAAYITDSVAVGKYAMDSHTVQYVTDSNGSHNEGQYWIGNVYPYQVSYRALVPQQLDGLLVPLAASSSRIAYSALRMEPIRMAMGQAAGVAAAMAAQQQIQPRNLQISPLQRNIIAQGVALYVYTDTPTTYWAWQPIQQMTALGIVRGLGVPNTFAPEQQVTRAELAKMLVSTQGWELVNPPAAQFSDVPTDYWAYRYIETAYAHQAISGFPDGTFRPTAPVTRAQMARMVVKAAGYTAETPTTPTFIDVPANYWAYGYIESAKAHGLMNGVDPTHFQPDRNLSRAQATTTLYSLRER